MITRIIAAVLLTLGVTSSASAECAWVLWSGRGEKAPNPGRIVMSAFPKAEDCYAALAAIVEDMKKKHGTEGWVTTPQGSGWYGDPQRGRVSLTCLPDTVDPRGPKGK